MSNRKYKFDPDVHYGTIAGALAGLATLTLATWVPWPYILPACVVTVVASVALAESAARVDATTDGEG